MGHPPLAIHRKDPLLLNLEGHPVRRGCFIKRAFPDRDSPTGRAQGNSGSRDPRGRDHTGHHRDHRVNRRNHADPKFYTIRPGSADCCQSTGRLRVQLPSPLAMHYRWSSRDRQELFLCTEFARAIPPMPHAERLETAGKVMMRFAGFLPNLGVTPQVIPAMESELY